MKAVFVIILCIFISNYIYKKWESGLDEIFSQLDDDGKLTTMELAKKYGYICEEHTLQTADGYILKMHRLTGRTNGKTISKGAPTVLLMHGLFGASSSLFVDGDRSPAGILSDHGLDVWMGNCRGNRYSTNHTKLNKNDYEFWRFTYNEIALYDYVSFINYILKTVNKESLHFVGYSQAGIIMSSLLAYKPEHNYKIKSISYMASALALSRIDAVGINIMLTSMDYVSKNDFLLTHPFEVYPYSPFLIKLKYNYCNTKSVLFDFCYWFYMQTFGFDENKSDLSRFPYVISQFGNGISSNQMLQFSQCYVDKKLSLFDYGPTKNLETYGIETTPVLNFSVITAAKLFVYGTKDHLIPRESVLATLPLVNNVKKVVEVKGYNHLNFMHAIDIKEKVYDVVAEHVKLIN